MKRLVLLTLIVVSGFRTTLGQIPEPTATVAPEIPGVVAGGTPVEVIARGLRGTEGPIAAPDGTLLFTEQDANRISRITADGRIVGYLTNTGGAIGLAYDHLGRLIAAQTTPPQIAVLSPTRDVLADSWDGMPLLRPNDLTTDRRGGIYFSDPGQPPGADGVLPPAPRRPAVFYIRPDGGELIKVAEDIERPNGVLLSPDEQVLYVANTLGDAVVAFDVQADGMLTNRRPFAGLEGVVKTAAGVRSGADGLAIDSDGRLYVASLAGIQIFSPQGMRLGTIPIGITGGPQNLAFAGPGRRTLYVVGRNAAWKIAMRAQGPSNRAK
jgi:gluconolactonase